VLRHLERHEVEGGQGAILHGLYDGTRQSLGRTVPLTEHPATAGLVDGLVDGNRKPTGIGQLTAEYVPNMRPNRTHRGSDLGRSDYQGTLDLHDALDETWTSWMRDLRLGRGRLVVPSSYLQTLGRGKGAEFDADREVYAALEMPPTGSAGGANLTLTQFEIRVEQHSQTAQELVSRIVAVAGYSGQTFGLAGDVAATATEVTARERKSFITRDKKQRYWRPGLGRMGEVLLQLDVALGLAPQGVVPGRPTVEFGDSVSEDPKDVATTLDLLHRAAALSTQTKVERLHPDWTPETVAEEVARIHAEQGMAVPDVVDGPLPGDALPA
jgi:A118 family predicted phage portal protein